MKALLYGIVINLFTFNLVYSSNITTLTYDQQIIAMTILGEARNQKEEVCTPWLRYSSQNGQHQNRSASMPKE